MMKSNETYVTMSTEDFGVCLAALVQTESYWSFQLKMRDEDIPGGFSREEVLQIVKSILDVKNKIESILRFEENTVNEDHVVVS